MVASTVYGVEGLLDQIYASLTAWGYRVWMSHAGTIPTHPKLSNSENCVRAAKECDLFLGIITGRHGSGIFRKEIETAVSDERLRWFLVHHDVVVARQLLKQFRFDKNGRPTNLKFAKTPVLESLETLETYEAAIQDGVPIASRRGNWAQEFFKQEDALNFINTQFRDIARIAQMLSEHRTSP